jgi:hypothetical protein
LGCLLVILLEQPSQMGHTAGYLQKCAVSCASRNAAFCDDLPCQISKVRSTSTVALASDTFEVPQCSAKIGKLERLAMFPSGILWKSLVRGAQLCS